MPTAKDRTTSASPKTSGIYRIRCTANGKAYIGSAVNFGTRWKNHRKRLNGGVHENRHLQGAWDKYGPDAFVFEVLEFVEDKADLIPREQEWLDCVAPFGRAGFNLHATAGSPLGTKRSAATRARMSAVRIGMKFTAEHCANISAAKRDRPPSEEQLAALAFARANREYTPESIEKTAAAHRGRKRSQDTCDRIAAKARGRTQSPEHIAKRVAKLEGRNQYTDGGRDSDETRAKKSASHMGLRPSPETRARLSEAQRRRHAARRAQAEAARTESR